MLKAARRIEMFCLRLAFIVGDLKTVSDDVKLPAAIRNVG